MKTNYSNFHDPVGLVRRMLRSGDRAARSSLLRAVAQPLLSPLDLVMASSERRRVAEAADTKPPAPVIHVVGGPRSGTTLVYQTLARHLDVSYLNNLSALFPRSPITAMRTLNRFTASPPAEMHSYYGNTRGLAAPNDSFHVWNRWLGTDRYTTPERLSPVALRQMRAFFAAMHAAFGKPVLSKNNRNASCIPLLAQALPGSLFVFVRRDPVYTAQSLLIAREEVQGSREVGWGLASPTSGDTSGDPIMDVCRQVDAVERMLDAARAGLRASRTVEFDYNEFCAQPAAAVAKVHRYLVAIDSDIDAPESVPTPLRASARRVLPEADFERIVACLAELGAQSRQPAVPAPSRAAG